MPMKHKLLGRTLSSVHWHRWLCIRKGIHCQTFLYAELHAPTRWRPISVHP